MMMRVNEVTERMMAVPKDSAVRTRNNLTAVDPPPATVCKLVLARLTREGATEAGMVTRPVRPRRATACAAALGHQGFRPGVRRTRGHGRRSRRSAARSGKAG